MRSMFDPSVNTCVFGFETDIGTLFLLVLGVFLPKFVIIIYPPILYVSMTEQLSGTMQKLAY